MKASKKLIGASVALVAALAVSVGTTFAWFTTNDTVAVNGINATVTTGDSNLEIVQLLDGVEVGNYSYSLNLAASNFQGIELDALTSTDNGATLTKRPALGDYTTPGAAGTANADYIELYFRVRTTAETAPKITLVADSSKVESTPSDDVDEVIKAWETIGANSYGQHAVINEGDIIQATAANTVRVGFFEATTTTGATTVGAAKGVWEPNAEAGFYGKHSKTTGGYAAKLAEAWELYQDSLKGGSNETAIKAIYADTSYTAFTPGTSTIELSKQGTAELVGTGYYYTDFAVKIWIEGTDGECFNNIFDHSISISLVFKTVSED